MLKLNELELSLIVRRAINANPGISKTVANAMAVISGKFKSEWKTVVTGRMVSPLSTSQMTLEEMLDWARDEHTSRMACLYNILNESKRIFFNPESFSNLRHEQIVSSEVVSMWAMQFHIPSEKKEMVTA